jgi:site-specific DNA recombinase
LKAIERVESGESDGLVVAYASRFGRSQLDGLLAIDRIVKAGGVFVSAAEGLDYSTDIGRHMLRTMLSWGEWELDRVRATWRVANERAVQRGVFVGGVPFGYQRGKGGRLRIHPVHGPVVTELFRRRADGATVVELRRWLIDDGVKTSRGDLGWHTTTLKKKLENRTYLGEARYRGVVNRSAHPPLTDPETWELAQFPGVRTPPRGFPPAPLLWGMVRCGNCGRPLGHSRAFQGTSVHARRYRCRGETAAIPCRAPAYVGDATIEPYVEALFLQELCRAARRPKSVRVAKLEEAVERRERELDAYRENQRLPVTLGPDRFADGLEVRTRRAARARLELAQARRAARSPKLPPVQELERQWPTLSVAERRAAIGEVIDCVMVWPGTRQPIEDRSVVFLAGQAPPDLPRPTNGTSRTGPPRWHRSARRDRVSASPRTGQLSGYEQSWTPSLRTRPLAELPGVPRSWAGAPSRATARHAHPRRWAQVTGLPYFIATPDGRPWSDERIRSELAAFLAGRREWPTSAEFNAADQAQLRTAVTAFGGPERWAGEMSVEFSARRRGREYQWTYPRMRREVARLTEGRTNWPRQAEFAAAGLLGLYRITGRRHLRPRLARELGLTPPVERKPRTPSWTDQEIRAALDDFLKGRSTWPTTTEFRRAGLGSLIRRITSRTARPVGTPLQRRPTDTANAMDGPRD